MHAESYIFLKINDGNAVVERESESDGVEGKNGSEPALCTLPFSSGCARHTFAELSDKSEFINLKHKHSSEPGVSNERKTINASNCMQISGLLARIVHRRPAVCEFSVGLTVNILMRFFEA